MSSDQDSKFTKGLSYIKGPSFTQTVSTTQTGWRRFKFFVDTRPDKLAVVSMHQSSTLYPIDSVPLETDEYMRFPYLRWSYRSLMSAIDRLALELHSRGVRPGMKVVTFLENGVECVISRMTASRLGCVFAPLKPRHLTNRNEVAHLLRLFSLEEEEETGTAVVIAGDGLVAARLETEHSEFIRRCSPFKIVCSTPSARTTSGKRSLLDWLSLEDLMTELPLEMAPRLGALNSPTDEHIVCTSGTTALPKACRWTNSQVAYHYRALEQTGVHQVSSEDNVAVVLSHSHIAGYDAISSALLLGGTAVFPGPTIDTGQFTNALRQERVTYTLLVPTMVALIAEAVNKPWPKSNIRINLGGDVITPSDVDLCYRMLGASSVYNTFGNSEGAFIKSGRIDRETVHGLREVPLRCAFPNQSVKVCVEIGRSPGLAGIGTSGELHISSPGACTGYLGTTKSESFYTDEEGQRWYATGDWARMEPDGSVVIVGRRKDIIIRGGQNISPAAIETVLARGLAPRDICIVGISTTEGRTGQVPAAVTRSTISANEAMSIRETVREAMGAGSCPDNFVSLAQLGLDDYPRTASGKVKRQQLAESVQRYVDQPGSLMQSRPETETSTFRALKLAWARVLGLDASILSHDSQMADLADSITTTRLLGRLPKIFGKKVTLSEFVQAETLGQQAFLLDAKPKDKSEWQQNASGHPDILATSPRSTDPPAVEDLVHLTENPDRFEATKKVIESALHPAGLTWNDVREVMPAHDMNYVSFLLGQMNRMNLRVSIVLKDVSVSKERLLDALEAVFTNNPMLASFEVLDKNDAGQDTLLHVVTAQPRQFLDRLVFRDGGTLDKVAQLKEFAASRMFPDCSDATYPGPLTKVDVFLIDETSSVGFVLNTNHSIMDASFSQLVYEDLNTIFAHPDEALDPHLPYKAWADSYYTLSFTPAARAATHYQAQSLRDLASHRHAIWPAHPPAYVLPRQINRPSDGTGKVYMRIVEAPGLNTLRNAHPEIGSSIPLKAAMAMFLMRRTRHSHALFAHVEGLRGGWPFWPKHMSELSASNLSGQTLQTVINLTSLEPNETVLAFLKRMQTIQILQTRHAAAPRRAVMTALGDSGELVPWVGNTALFNWSPAKTASSYEAFDIVDVALSWDVFSFMVMGGLAGEEKMWLRLRGATLGSKELDSIGAELGMLTRWLVSTESWGEEAQSFREL